VNVEAAAVPPPAASIFDALGWTSWVPAVDLDQQSGFFCRPVLMPSQGCGSTAEAINAVAADEAPASSSCGDAADQPQQR
jgi:hypothetical protein